MPIAHQVSAPPEKKECDVQSPKTLSPSSFNFGYFPVPRNGRKHGWQGWWNTQSELWWLLDDKPFWERSRPHPPVDVEALRQHLSQLKDAGVITKSRSPYASPIVVVRTKTEKIRMCVDFTVLHCTWPVHSAKNWGCFSLSQWKQMVLCAGPVDIIYCLWMTLTKRRQLSSALPDSSNLREFQEWQEFQQHSNA